MDTVVGSLVGGRYQVLEKHAAGGFATVYRVRHSTLGSMHALKVLDTTSQVIRERLLDEGRIQATLRHPNLVRVTDVVDVSGQPGLVMDFVEGPTLKAHLANNSPSPREAMRLARAIVAGTAAAHRAGLIHRDIKPGNILLEAGAKGFVPRVTDFGLAKLVQQTLDGHTLRGVAMGTPGFMAPEQYRDAGNVTQAADVFALGVVLYEIFTGNRPFLADDLKHLAKASASGDYTPVAQRAPDLPEVLTQAIEACLEPDPDHRPANAMELSGLLDQLSDEDLGDSLQPVQHTPTRAFSVNTQRPTVTSIDVPAEKDAFVGREGALRELQRLTEKNRLVTVVDAGGVGKTRLVVHFAHTRGRRFPGGIVYCDLSDGRSLSDIVTAVGQALDLQLADAASTPDVVLEALAGRGQCLVILDNFEQLVEHAQATVGMWTADLPECTFLITSREALRVAREVTLPLGPLTLPADDSAEAIVASEAGALFLSRAQVVRPDLRLTERNAAAVAGLLRDLDGIPLALELAASRLRTLNPEQVRDRLKNRFKLLRTRKRDAAGRQATLLATLDWSWDLLKRIERVALVQASVFTGGFDLEAAESVIDMSRLDDSLWELDVVESLVDKSLIRASELDGLTRYSLYASIADYAQRKLETPEAIPPTPRGELTGPVPAAAARLRHVSYYVEQSRNVSLPDDLWVAGGDALYDRLSHDRGNVLAALETAANHGDWASAARLTVMVASLALIVGPFDTALTWIERCLEQELEEEARWELLFLGAAVSPALQRLDAGAAWSDEALAIARRHGWKEREARTLREWGSCHAHLVGREQARESWLEGIRCLEGLQAPFPEALLCYNLAADALRRGASEDLAEWARRSLRAAHRAGIGVLQVTGHMQLGAVARIRGDLETARNHLEAAVRRGSDSRNRQWEVETRPELARVAEAEGKLGEACTQLRLAAQAARAIGDAQDEAFLMFQAGRLELTRGRLHEANRLANALEDLGRRNADDNAEARGHLLHACAHLHGGRPQAAQAVANLALTAARHSGDRDLVGLALACQARCQRLCDVPDLALASVQAGLDLDLGAEARAELQLEGATLAQATGDSVSARELAEEAIATARTIGSVRQHSQGLLTLAEIDLASGDSEHSRGRISELQTMRGLLDDDDSMRLRSLEQRTAAEPSTPSV